MLPPPCRVNSRWVFIQRQPEIFQSEPNFKSKKGKQGGVIVSKTQGTVTIIYSPFLNYPGHPSCRKGFSITTIRRSVAVKNEKWNVIVVVYCAFNIIWSKLSASFLSPQFFFIINPGFLGVAKGSKSGPVDVLRCGPLIMLRRSYYTRDKILTSWLYLLTDFSVAKFWQFTGIVAPWGLFAMTL